MRDKQVAARKARRDSLERSQFGILGTPAADQLRAMRDAYNRADQLETEDAALALMKRARQSGDTQLTKAVAQRADNQG